MSYRNQSQRGIRQWATLRLMLILAVAMISGVGEAKEHAERSEAVQDGDVICSHYWDEGQKFDICSRGDSIIAVGIVDDPLTRFAEILVGVASSSQMDFFPSEHVVVESFKRLRDKKCQTKIMTSSEVAIRFRPRTMLLGLAHAMQVAAEARSNKDSTVAQLKREIQIEEVEGRAARASMNARDRMMKNHTLYPGDSYSGSVFVDKIRNGCLIRSVRVVLEDFEYEYVYEHPRFRE